MSLINDMLKDLENSDDQNKKAKEEKPALKIVDASLDLSSIATNADKIKQMDQKDFDKALQAVPSSVKEEVKAAIAPATVSAAKSEDKSSIKSVKIDWNLLDIGASEKVADAPIEKPILNQEKVQDAMSAFNAGAKIENELPKAPEAVVAAAPKAATVNPEKPAATVNPAKPAVSATESNVKQTAEVAANEVAPAAPKQSLFYDVPYTLKELKNTVTNFKLSNLKVDRFDTYKHTPIIMFSAVIIGFGGYWLGSSNKAKPQSISIVTPITPAAPVVTQKGNVSAQDRAAAVEKELNDANNVTNNAQITTTNNTVENKATVNTEVQQAVVSIDNTKATLQDVKNISESMGTITSITSERVIRAVKLVQLGDSKEAERLLLEELVDEPLSIVARKTLSLIYLETNRIEKARRIIKQGLEYYPQDETLLRVSAKIYVKSGDYAQALQVLEQVKTPAVAEDPEFFALRADLYRQIGEYQMAVDNYIAILARFPDVGKWWVGLALSLEELKRYPEAIESYIKALQTEDLSLKLKLFTQNRIKQLDPNNQAQYTNK